MTLVSKYKFKEVTDLKMNIDYSKGDDVGEFKEDSECREFFVVYDGPPVNHNKDEFFKELKKWMSED